MSYWRNLSDRCCLCLRNRTAIIRVEEVVSKYVFSLMIEPKLRARLLLRLNLGQEFEHIDAVRAVREAIGSDILRRR